MANVTVTKDRYTVEPLYQWDLNQDLIIKGLSLPMVPEIHFTNSTMDRALVRQSTMDSAGVITVKVPNSLLQKPNKITAYVCIDYNGVFKSLYAIDIPVKARKKPDDYTFEDSNGEIYSFNALENMVANALDKLESDREDTLSAVQDATNKVIDSLNEKNEIFLNDLKTSNENTLKSFEEEINEKYDEVSENFDKYVEYNGARFFTKTGVAPVSVDLSGTKGEAEYTIEYGRQGNIMTFYARFTLPANANGIITIGDEGRPDWFLLPNFGVFRIAGSGNDFYPDKLVLIKNDTDDDLNMMCMLNPARPSREDTNIVHFNASYMVIDE